MISLMAGQEQRERQQISISIENSPKMNKSKTIQPFELEMELVQQEYGEMSTSSTDYDYNDDDEDLNDLLALLPGRSTSGKDSDSPIIQLHFQRWIQLGYLSGLAMLSDWICFSVAASAETFEELYDIEDSTKLIDWFLFVNVATCFLVTDCVAKYGLRTCIRWSAALMAIGTWFRALSIYADYHYPSFVVGTLLVGAAQPFFQCTPPLLSALWFASNERATSTAIALNFNQIGIATAFLIGGPMGSSVKGLTKYFQLMAFLGTLLAIGTWLQFEAKPPTPPSVSEWSKIQANHQEPPFYRSARQFLSNPGFRKALTAFICSIAITNVVGALIEDIMNRGGVKNTWGVAISGGVFEFTIVLGGIVLGGYVDRTKRYKQVTLLCLVLSILLLLPLGWTDHKLGTQPMLVVGALALLGFFTGPVQPINAELAVDVTYPGDETAVESVQQIGGNLVSALLMPCAEWASRQDYQLLKRIPLLESDIRGDIVLLVVVTVVTILYFSTFEAPLRRTLADARSHSQLYNLGHDSDI